MVCFIIALYCVGLDYYTFLLQNKNVTKELSKDAEIKKLKMLTFVTSIGDNFMA